MVTSSPFLRVEGISKSFPGVRALDDVSLELREGEVGHDRAVDGGDEIDGYKEKSRADR